MELFILSFVAGILTIAAPCILPLLPVVLGKGLSDDTSADAWKKPVVIIASLAVSISLFTLLLKASTALLGVPVMVWQFVSGGIVTLFGLQLLWPASWEWLVSRSGLTSVQLPARWRPKQPGVLQDAASGLALGPVFNSCSPTYALIVAAILPTDFGRGLLYLLAYVIGLCGTLLVIALAGQAAVQKLGWLANPHGWFKRVMGGVLVLIGLMIVFGLDKKFQVFVLERGWYQPISGLEEKLH